MNSKTLFQQLKISLKSLVWGSTSNKIFGDNVFITVELPIQQLGRYAKPTCFIVDQGANPYEQHPLLFEQNFSLMVFVENVNDVWGEGSLLSSNRTTDTSRGAGIFDIEEEVLSALKVVTSLSSAKIVLLSKSKAKPVFIKGNEPIIYKIYNFRAFVESEGATPDPDQILRVPGQLYWNPTNPAAGSYGTRLGFLEAGVLFQPNLQYSIITGEETGQEPKAKLYIGSKPQVIAQLLNYNATNLGILFPGLSGTTFLKNPSKILAGTKMDASSSHYGRLLFVPDDTSKNPCLLLQKALPNHEKTVLFTRDGNTVFSCVFDGFRSTSDDEGIYYVGPIGSAVLR